MANNNLSNGLVALLAGLGIGAVAGILFAPEKGSVLRKRIKNNAENEVQSFKKKFKGLKREVQEKAQEKEHAFADRFNSLVSKSNHKSEEVIAALEKKLIELKELRAKSTTK